MAKIKSLCREYISAIMYWAAQRSSYDNNIVDKVCRWVLRKYVTLPPEEDFLRDALIDNDEGFDPDELEKYQRGESITNS